MKYGYPLTAVKKSPANVVYPDPKLRKMTKLPNMVNFPKNED